MNKIKATIYDFDGTLGDTLQLHLDAYTFSLAKLRIKTTEQEIISKCFNKTDTQAAKNYNLKDVQLFSKYYRDKVVKEYKHIKLYQDVVSTLREIAKLNLQIAIGTSRTGEEINQVIDKLGIKNFFRKIITHDDIMKNKTRQELFQEICKFLKVKSSEVIIVGDSENDIITAKKIKAKSVLFYPTQHSKFYKLQDLKKLKPDFIIDDHSKIIKIIQKNI
jgi:HAD superfamily hydrolase (TIGR01549 family)